MSQGGLPDCLLPQKSGRPPNTHPPYQISLACPQLAGSPANHLQSVPGKEWKDVFLEQLSAEEPGLQLCSTHLG